MQKRRIATCGTHELLVPTRAKTGDNPTVDHLVEGNGICIGEHRQKVC
jgi:hypothetical protein